MNSMLLPVEVMQAWKYYRRYPNDPFLLRAIVAFSNLTNTVNNIAQYACVYLVRVSRSHVRISYTDLEDH